MHEFLEYACAIIAYIGIGGKRIHGCRGDKEVQGMLLVVTLSHINTSRLSLGIRAFLLLFSLLVQKSRRQAWQQDGNLAMYLFLFSFALASTWTASYMRLLCMFAFSGA